MLKRSLAWLKKNDFLSPHYVPSHYICIKVLIFIIFSLIRFMNNNLLNHFIVHLLFFSMKS